ncbi:SDR family oxidoreductase [Alcaligenaceae bacterium A4P071]|nr:SDR family oxidoreductase [Alcaligenaceae bacterium A4P071]
MVNAFSPAPRVCVITGAAGDIGSAITERFLAQGCRVAALDLNATVLAERYKAWSDVETDAQRAPDDGILHDGSADLMMLACNVADTASVVSAIDAVAARWGRVDVLVNNAAAVTSSQPVCDLDEAAWQVALDVNLTGAWRMSRACVPHMAASGGGVILNMSSQLGHVTAAGRGAYGVSKAALMALTRSLAVDYADQGIRAVSLSPGAVLTSRVVKRYGGADAATRTLAPRYPMQRLGTVEDVAEAALFLTGDGAGFITGTDLLVDGGYTAV